jgi:hypothetical protein
MGLAGLRGRLLGGVHESLSLTRRAGHFKADLAVLAAWPPAKFPPLDRIRDDTWDPGHEPRLTLEGILSDLRGNRGLLAAVTFSPHLLLARMLQLCGSADRGLIDTWISICWVTEAAWDAITTDLPAGAGYMTGDAELLRPVAARTRFLVLSEPMRHRTKTSGTLWEADSDALGANGVLDSVFGLDSWADLVGRCREARREWQDCLDTYQSYPLLRLARPGELEDELRSLLLARDQPGPLVLSVGLLAEQAAATPEDTAVITDSAERHLLPRFAVGLVARLSLYDDRPRWRWTRRLFAAAVAAAGLASVGSAVALSIYLSAWLALACYALLVTGVAVLPDGWGTMWLLRMPAASAVGVFALISFLPGGWLQQAAHGHWTLSAHTGWAAAAVLTGVSLGYLLVEARSHGVARHSAWPRALLVGAIGTVHALMVALIGLVVIAPAVIQNGDQLSSLWSHPGYRHTGVVIAVAAAWCLAVGVFSQILWDDRPITAPLAHLSWRR